MTTLIEPMHREEQRMLLKRLHTIGVSSVSCSHRIPLGCSSALVFLNRALEWLSSLVASVLSWPITYSI